MLKTVHQSKLLSPLQTKQDEFLSYLVEQKKPISIYLKSGVRLQGFINSFDCHMIFLNTNSEEKNSANHQMIYKHAISTIVDGVQIIKSARINASSALEKVV